MRKLILLFALLATACSREVYVSMPAAPEPEIVYIETTPEPEPEPEIVYIEVTPTPKPCRETSPDNKKFQNAVIRYYVTHNRGCSSDREWLEKQPPSNNVWRMISLYIYRDWDHIYEQLEKLKNYDELHPDFSQFFCE